MVAQSITSKSSPELRREAGELILRHLPLCVLIVQKKYSRAILTARTLGRIESRNPKDAVYDAFPQLLQSAIQYLRSGQARGYAIGTFLDWGLRAWASVVWREMLERRAHQANEADLEGLQDREQRTSILEGFEAILNPAEIELLAKLAEGWSAAELARQTGRTRAQVGEVKRRAFEKVRRQLGPMTTDCH